MGYSENRLMYFLFDFSISFPILKKKKTKTLTTNLKKKCRSNAFEARRTDGKFRVDNDRKINQNPSKCRAVA